MPRENDDGTIEGFCPRCYDYHLFETETQSAPLGGKAVVALCMHCEFACEPDLLPHDASQADEMFPGEVGA